MVWKTTAFASVEAKTIASSDALERFPLRHIQMGILRG